MRTKILSIFIFTVFAINLSAQQKKDIEIGVGLGLSLYNGDLSSGEFDDYLEDLRPAGTIFGKMYFTDWLAGRLGLSIGYLVGDDDPDRKNAERNLDFRSILLEGSAIVEIYPFKIGGRTDQKLSPYLFGGISGFYFNPKTDFNGTTYTLQSIGTEGQGLANHPAKYYRAQLASVLGGGLRLEMNNGWAIFGEIGARYAFTDYLDDVSATELNYDVLVNGNGTLAGQLSVRNPDFDPSDVNNITYFRGGSSNDWYLIGTIGIALKLSSRLGGSGVGCPTF